MKGLLDDGKTIGEITCVLLNNKKDQLITASADRSIKIIDLKDDYVVHTFADYHSRKISQDVHYQQ